MKSAISYPPRGINGHLLDNFVRQQGVIKVAKAGGDFKKIQQALDICKGGEVVIVYPGTYVESLTSTANNVTIAGVGTPEETNIMQEDAQVLNITHTKFRLTNVQISLTAPTQQRNMIEVSGQAVIRFCRIKVTDTHTGPQSHAVYSTGTTKIRHGVTLYTSTGDAGGGEVICPFEAGVAGTIDIALVSNINVSSTGTCLATTVIGTAGVGASVFKLYKSVITVTGEQGLAVGVGYTTTAIDEEILYNNIHANATGVANNSIGIYLAGTGNLKSSYNHIHCTTDGGTAGSFTTAGTATFQSHFDDIVAPDGLSIGGGAYTMASSTADGELTTGPIHASLKSGADQGAAGAAAGELWHNTGDDTIRMGT